MLLMSGIDPLRTFADRATNGAGGVIVSYRETGQAERAGRLVLWIVIAVLVLALPASCLFLPFIAGG